MTVVKEQDKRDCGHVSPDKAQICTNVAVEAEDLVAKALAAFQWEGWRPVEIDQSFECVLQSQPMLVAKEQGRRDCGHVSPDKTQI